MKQRMLITLVGLALLLMTACASQDTSQATPSSTPTLQPTIQPAPATQAPSAEPSQSPGAGAALKDGEYTAQMSDRYAKDSGHGWQEYLKVTISGGQVTEAEYDALKDGKLKSQTTQEEYKMSPHPSQWIPQLTANVKKAASPQEVDAVSGATDSSKTVKKLYAAIWEAAQTGNTEIITLEK